MVEPQTKLGGALAGKKSPESKFAAAMSGARIYVPWTIPRLGLDVEVTLVGAERTEEIEGSVLRRMAELGIPQTDANVPIYELARLRRLAAEACVEPVTHVPVGTLAEWAVVDVDVVGDFGRRYGDVREMSDPITQPMTLAELAWIGEALKKNDGRLLRLCGLNRLSRFLLSMDAQQLVSASLRYGDGVSSLDSLLSPESLAVPQ